LLIVRTYIFFGMAAFALSGIALYGNARGANPQLDQIKTPAPVSIRDHCNAGHCGITVDDLVRRAQIPLAALSPDGRYAAYLVVRGDPILNSYRVVLRLVDTELVSQPINVSEYLVSPEEMFDETGSLMPGSGEIRWMSADELLFTARAGDKMTLTLLHVRDRSLQTLSTGHDRVEIVAVDKAHASLSIVTTDFISMPANPAPRDYSWLVRDDYRFYGPLKNPKTGRWVRRQRYSFGLAPEPALRLDGPSIEEWDRVPATWALPVSPIVENGNETIQTERIPSGDGSKIAVRESRYLNLINPSATYVSFRVVVLDGPVTTVLVPDTHPFLHSSLLSWTAGDNSINYLQGGPTGTSLKNVTLHGRIKEILRVSELLSKPCLLPAQSTCQVTSDDGRMALLVRSSNVIPGDLVKVDLNSGALTLLDAPNGVFATAPHPEVRFYKVGDTGGDTWGRLYLPLYYVKGRRYPLVITNYESSPGFGEATGDEVPILPLVESGIAVFDMYSAALNAESPSGDFRIEIERVRRPLKGMKWIAHRLIAEGIVDSQRIGVAGLSYGAEIAMYAYWNWRGLCTVSAATASWDPSGYLFAGKSYSHFLNRRGFPQSSETQLTVWRELAAGLNARADLPPLLLQSPDGEEYFTEPTWFRLRNAGAPVEWYEYPNEGHVKRNPADKWWVFQRNLEWFRFWMNDVVDADPMKNDQYSRWASYRQK
jgi:hypothetical protein